MARVLLSDRQTLEPTSGSTKYGSAGDLSSINPDSVKDRVINSTAYQNAYNLFSSASDPIWLQRLEAIPTSVSDAEATWFDEVGLINKYDDKQNANYQYCIEQITALVGEYHSWVNSLPKTQAQQMADAGVNSAITGQGLSSSSVAGSNGVSSNPSSLESGSHIDYLSNVVGFVSDFNNGFLGWMSAFTNLYQQTNQVKQFNQNQNALWHNYVHTLSNEGVILPAEINSFEALSNWMSEDPKYNNIYDNSNSRGKQLLNEYNEILTGAKTLPLIASSVQAGDYKGSSSMLFQDGKNNIRIGSSKGVSFDIVGAIGSVVQGQYEDFVKTLQYQVTNAIKSKENEKSMLEEGVPAQIDKTVSDAGNSSLEFQKFSMYVNRLKEWNDKAINGDLAHQLLLMDALGNMELDWTHLSLFGLGNLKDLLNIFSDKD